MRRKEQAAEVEPEIPAEFIIGDLDMPGAFRDLGRELKASGIDTSGRDKVLRVLRPASWRLHVMGGGATADREHLAGLRLSRQATEARAADLEARGERRGAESVRSGLAGIDQDIAKHEALVAAAGDAPDQATRRARLESARRLVADLNGRLEPYRTARIVSAERTALEDKLLTAERGVTEAEAEWESGRRKFEALGAEVGELTARLYAAIVAEGETLCVHIGAEAKVLCMADLDLYTRFPHRAPDGVIALAKRAERIAELMDRLGGTVRRGLAAFWEALGDADVIVRAKLGIGPSPRGGWMRPAKDPFAAHDVESRIGVT